ncbi:MAG: hypothetical protein ACKVWV_02650 [Planctomycetota bacterium]
MNTKHLFLAALALLPLGCRSTSEASVPCTCGQPTTNLEGCAHSKCVAGETNTDNPSCVCGTLQLKN